MDHVVAKRVLPLYVYRDWSNIIGRLPTAMITFSSIFKSPVAGRFFDMCFLTSTCFPGCITKEMSFDRVQVASQYYICITAICCPES